MLKLLIEKRSLGTFSYLFNEFPNASQYISYTHLKIILSWVMKAKWAEGIQELICGSTIRSLFRSFTVRGRLQMIGEIFEKILNDHEIRALTVVTDVTKTISTMVQEVLLQQPYISVTFVNALKGIYDDPTMT